MKPIRCWNRTSLRFDLLEERACPAILGSLLSTPALLSQEVTTPRLSAVAASVTAAVSDLAQPTDSGPLLALDVHAELPDLAATDLSVSIAPTTGLLPVTTNLGVRANVGRQLSADVTAAVGGDSLLSVRAAAANPSAPGVAVTVTVPPVANQPGVPITPPSRPPVPPPVVRPPLPAPALVTPIVTDHDTHPADGPDPAPPVVIPPPASDATQRVTLGPSAVEQTSVAPAPTPATPTGSTLAAGNFTPAALMMTIGAPAPQSVEVARLTIAEVRPAPSAEVPTFPAIVVEALPSGDQPVGAEHGAGVAADAGDVTIPLVTAPGPGAGAETVPGAEPDQSLAVPPGDPRAAMSALEQMLDQLGGMTRDAVATPGWWGLGLGIGLAALALGTGVRTRNRRRPSANELLAQIRWFPQLGRLS